MSGVPGFSDWFEDKVNVPAIRRDFRAGEDLPAGAAVYMNTDGKVYLYKTTEQDRYIGVTKCSGAIHCSVTVVLNGYLKVENSGWNRGVVYYVQNGGGLVPTVADAKIAVGVGHDAIVVFNNLTEIDYFILTTVGNSGPATLTGGNLLNIPNYTLAGLGGVPLTRTITINGVTQDLSANRSWTTVSSVGLTMPAAFGVAGSPITSFGTLAVTALGNPTQYIRGDGQLAPIAAITGGGTTVKYYLNGSINQGVFLGNTYYQMRKVPVFGAGTNFSTAVNGLLAEFITNPADPSTTSIPAGNWIFRGYLQASTNLGTPSFYVEIAKWDGVGFTLIGSTVATPELITGGTSTDLYTTAVAVPLTTLAVTDRLVVRVYTTVSGNTITLYTEGANLAEVETTFSTGLVSLNGLNDPVQFFAIGTAGTDFNIVSAAGVHTYNLPVASAVNTGKLSAADWSTFNSKEPAIPPGTVLQYWRGDKSWQTLNTSVVPEGTNLYYTDARARLAISLTTLGTSGAATYNNISGVLNIPQYQGAISLTTTGTGGAASLAANTLNIPRYLDADYQSTLINSNTVLAVTRDTHIYTVDLSGGPLTVTLPSALGNIATIHLKRIGTNNVLTVNTQLGQTIDGQPNVQSIQPYTSLMFIAYNNNWYIV